MGNPDLEVELDSLGLLFTRLIDDNACQDDAEASNAGFVEVTILSSDSEILPLPKFRRPNRKVKFSHPFAYLDSQFLMKTQQHEARRTTRHSGQVVTSAGLPNSPVRKRRSEVSNLAPSREQNCSVTDNVASFLSFPLFFMGMHYI